MPWGGQKFSLPSFNSSASVGWEGHHPKSLSSLNRVSLWSKKNELHIQSYADVICIVSTTYGHPAVSIT